LFFAPSLVLMAIWPALLPWTRGDMHSGILFTYVVCSNYDRLSPLWCLEAGAELAPAQAALVAGAVRQAQLAAQAQMQGPWCDVLGPLIDKEWARSRQAVVHTGAGSVHVAVHTWMQVGLCQVLLVMREG
jgi:hypothetical protein